MIRGNKGLWICSRPHGEPRHYRHEMAARAWEWFDNDADELDDLLDRCRVHHVKIRTEWFELLQSGAKPCEIRKNDRGYEIGDRIVLHEITATADGDKPTGRELVRRISLVVETEGIAEGYCLLCFEEGNQ